MYRMDDLDRRLIAALRRDGRSPVSTLAADLRTTRTTVTSRMKRLTDAGIIVGYTVRVDTDAEGGGLQAMSLIEVEGRTTDRVIHELRGLPEISALHTTNGGWDLIAELECTGLQNFDEVLRRIRGVPGIVNSRTHVLLRSVVR